MKVNIITLGCSKNVVDSENVAGHLKKAGWQVEFDSNSRGCDVVIVNTCGFIGDAKEESVNMLLEQIELKKRSRKKRRLYAVGCLVERYKKELGDEMPEVDGYFGAHEWNQLIETVTEAQATPLESERKRSTPRHYAYLKIAEGCDRSCAYCAIPGIRGKYVSRPMTQLLSEAATLVEEGVKELIIIAQDTTYYGLDRYHRRSLGELLERLANESGAEWIRLHYTYPAGFPLDVVDVMAQHDNICNYIDIPLQHINSQILQSIRRETTREQTLQLLQTSRSRLPNVALRTTLITGYPGETKAEFRELKDFVREANFERLGVFAYSPEEGTPAYRLGDPISEKEKQRRVGELMAIHDELSLQRNLGLVGRKMKVIIDRRENDFYIGRTEYDSPEVDCEVLIPTERHVAVGHFCTVEITDAAEHDLTGRLC